ncbi:5-hydroxytryptamine receptor 1F [Platysternon megacephalum]|uniref:5-hydroxytryptamine receptor 1F n=1 Tax=Platysternon megacephalum TaxID=55544 RepID=A0A4D9EQR8_9SAUR|nr:5-hydroxytryptamine receptor 1F [Platysternon megacephalum]
MNVMSMNICFSDMKARYTVSLLKRTFMNHFKRTLQLKTEEQYLSTLNKTFGEVCINISSYKHNTKLNSSDTQTPFNILPLLSKSSVNTISHRIQKQLLYQFCVHNTDASL